MHTNHCQAGCNQQCECHCYQPNCELVLQSFHKSVSDAFALFAESSQFETEALTETGKAIVALEKSIVKDDEGEKVYADAECALEHSGCNFTCNKNSCKCVALEEQVTCKFDLSERLKQEALCLLKEAAEKIYRSGKVQEEAVQLAEHYSKCVHEKNPHR